MDQNKYYIPANEGRRNPPNGKTLSSYTVQTSRSTIEFFDNIVLVVTGM